MQDGLADLDLGAAVVDGAADVDGQLSGAVEAAQHGDVQQAALAPLQPRPRPHRPPARPRHVLLHRPRELRRPRRQRPLHVRLARHRVPVLQPHVVEDLLRFGDFLRAVAGCGDGLLRLLGGCG